MSISHLTPLQALEKLKHYCAFQERCHYEVNQKLFDYGVYGEDADQILATLIQENYLNEERFATHFVGGKIRIKKWGRFKILAALKAKRISTYLINASMKQIDGDLYFANLKSILRTKNKTVKANTSFDRKMKLSHFAQQRGYELDIIQDALNEISDEGE